MKPREQNRVGRGRRPRARPPPQALAWPRARASRHRGAAAVHGHAARPQAGDLVCESRVALLEGVNQARSAGKLTPLVLAPTQTATPLRGRRAKRDFRQRKSRRVMRLAPRVMVTIPVPSNQFSSLGMNAFIPRDETRGGARERRRTTGMSLTQLRQRMRMTVTMISRRGIPMTVTR